jgi:hypothetical protein
MSTHFDGWTTVLGCESALIPTDSPQCVEIHPQRREVKLQIQETHKVGAHDKTIPQIHRWLQEEVIITPVNLGQSSPSRTLRGCVLAKEVSRVSPIFNKEVWRGKYDDVGERNYWGFTDQLQLTRKCVWVESSLVTGSHATENTKKHMSGAYEL